MEVDPAAVGRRDELLLSVARELLTNAARHARASRVELTLRSVPEGVVLEVADDGAGVPLGREREALAEGHIGLATSAERVAAVGGRLALEPLPGGGTCVAPSFRAEAIRAAPKWALTRRTGDGRRSLEDVPEYGRVTDGPGSQSRRMRVFIADDHAGYRGGMARLVGEHPALEVVGEAADGNEALAGVVALQPDVALLDIRMPGLTGLEVCRRLHADGSAPTTRVVLITGTPDRVIEAQAADAGAVALLAKETPPATICAELVAAGEGRVGWAVE